MRVLRVINTVATDNILNAAEKTAGVTVTGTAEAGASVVVSWGTASKTVTATGGTWSTSFSSAEVPADASTTTISAKATDAAGNASIANRVVAVDTTSSTVAAAVTGAADNVEPTIGNVATGGTSNDNTLGLSRPLLFLWH